ncbi:hypothetical protein D1872_266410 [compost metagenome]
MPSAHLRPGSIPVNHTDQLPTAVHSNATKEVPKLKLTSQPSHNSNTASAILVGSTDAVTVYRYVILLLLLLLLLPAHHLCLAAFPLCYFRRPHFRVSFQIFIRVSCRVLTTSLFTISFLLPNYFFFFRTKAAVPLPLPLPLLFRLRRDPPFPPGAAPSPMKIPLSLVRLRRP